MKKKNIAALLTAFAILLTGCNNTTDPPITDTSANTAQITEETAPETERTEALPVTAEAETNDTSAYTTEATDKASDTESETNSQTTPPEEETAHTEASSTTQAPVVTNPPPVKTDPPAVTTQAPPVTTAPVTTQPAEPSAPTIYENKASGTLTDSNLLATVDYSNTSDGYVMAKYTGSVSLIKVQITGPNGVTQTYTLKSDGSYGSFPLTGGNGTYSISVLENVGGKSYSVALSLSFNASIGNTLSIYLRSNEYVSFDRNNVAVQKASQLCGGNLSDLEKVDRVYSWLVDNVSYDYDRAKTVKGGELPDMNRVINNKKGICLDYAGTMTAMLRSQNIPTQMVVGYAGTQFHAWISVYITGTGWVHSDVYFDGSGWKRMDPTYASSSKSSKSILDFIANNGNYKISYLY